MENEKQKIEFAIIGLKEIGFSYREPYELMIELKNDLEALYKKIRAGLNINYQWNLDRNSFAILLDLYYKYDDNIKNIELVRFSSRTEFIVIDLKNNFKDNGNGTFEINEFLETTLVSLAISSGRGMLTARTTGTLIGNIVYPIVNAHDYILSKRIEDKTIT